MRWSSLAIALLNGVALASDATTTSSDSASSSSVNLADASTITPSSVAIPSGPYSTYSTTITLGNGESSLLVSSMLYGNASATPTANQTIVTASNTLTVLSGHGANTSAPIPNASQTPVVNTQPCNGWPEFCSRRYSNVTMVAAHNSPFVQPGNAASNQALDVTQQLNDGVRMRKYLHRSSKVLTSKLIQSSAIPNSLPKWHYDALPYLLRSAQHGYPRSLPDPSQCVGAPASL